jgi:hypothetical protein
MGFYKICQYLHIYSDLPLENLFDLLAFLSRPQLGQLASYIGNRRFATIVQTYLQKYVTQITLGPINLSKGFSLADWPIPEHVKITNFKSIQLRFVNGIPGPISVSKKDFLIVK